MLRVAAVGIFSIPGFWLMLTDKEYPFTEMSSKQPRFEAPKRSRMLVLLNEVVV
jgi:hypothetical protein